MRLKTRIQHNFILNENSPNTLTLSGLKESSICLKLFRHSRKPLRKLHEEKNVGPMDSHRIKGRKSFQEWKKSYSETILKMFLNKIRLDKESIFQMLQAST